MTRGVVNREGGSQATRTTYRGIANLSPRGLDLSSLKSLLECKPLWAILLCVISELVCKSSQIQAPPLFKSKPLPPLANLSRGGLDSVRDGTCRSVISPDKPLPTGRVSPTHVAKQPQFTPEVRQTRTLSQAKIAAWGWPSRTAARTADRSDGEAAPKKRFRAS